MAKIALLIGVSEYEPGLNSLPAAVKDVEAMRRVLANPEMGGFAEEDIAVLNNPQPYAMQTAIDNLFANRNKDDLLLLYFSGHGIKDEKGRLYRSTRATSKQNGGLVKPSAVAASYLHESMNESRSQRQVLILDCCFSGAIAQGLTVKDDGTVNVQEELGGKGRAILTSSTSTQYSFEQEGSELSIYTRYLVEGIEKGAADKDGDGWISVDELHEYASSKVQEAAPAMTPKFYPVEGGYRIKLAKSPKDDPKVKYRKEVESRAKQAQGKFSVFARRLLDSQWKEWGLSSQEAIAIEEEVLQPYREYERKRNEYEQALIEAVKQEYPFNQTTQKDLKDYQQYLGLRDEDIASIAQRVLEPKKAEYERNLQQEQQRQQEKLQEQLVEKQSSVPQLQSPSTIQTQSFEFEFVTLTPVRKRSGLFGFGGESTFYEINRNRGRAEFFTEDLGNGILLEMVAISGGQFLMGSPENELERRESESPQHIVTIQPFYMGKYAVTQEQWQAVMGNNPSRFQGAKRPVENVSWDDAVEFCQRLARKTGKDYRLPSEAEWEYAAHAGTTTPFHFGETISTDLANYRGTDWTYEGKVYPGNYGHGSKGIFREQTTEVGKFSPNAFGLYEMHGNIWEWCQDTWHENYEGAPSDGTAWVSENDNNSRLLRGGSWDTDPGYCRSAIRNGNSHDGRLVMVGFRVVVGG